MKFVLVFLVLAHQKLLTEGCGIPSAPPDTSVAEGKAAAESWPWEVSIEIFFEPSCIGTLIGSRWVLTIARCVDGYENSPKEFIVRVGGKEMAVERIVMHPNYDMETGDNDIALIKLSSDVINPQPACLPQPGSDVIVGKSCFVLQQRFEWTGYQGKVNLIQKRVKVLSNAECSTMKATQPWKSIRPSMLCTANDGSPNPYQGQFGGSLVCKSASGSWTAYGAASWIFKDHASEPHIVFSRVSKNLLWAKTTMFAN